jgi:UPF0755 protein
VDREIYAARQAARHNQNKKRKGRKGIFIVIAVLVVLLIAGVAGYKVASAPVTLAETVTVEIAQGSGSQTIAQELETAGVIKNATLFRYYVRSTGQADELKAGIYDFGPGELSYADIAAMLVAGGRAANTQNITIPEGLTVEQTADLLAEQGVVDKQEFLDYAANGDFSYDYIPAAGNYERLEGFLYPETYNIMVSWGAKEIIDMMLAQFDKVFTEEWRQRADELGYSIYEIVTMASIVEREALLDSERPLIAGVFYNRLDINMALQSCATVQYILGENKPNLTYADISIDDPYNTYIYPGLPPGPIASPGAVSLEAALYPEESDYLYFVAKGDGSHHFSKTLEEHNAAKEEYLN